MDFRAALSKNIDSNMKLYLPPHHTNEAARLSAPIGKKSVSVRILIASMILPIDEHNYRKRLLLAVAAVVATNYPSSHPLKVNMCSKSTLPHIPHSVPSLESSQRSRYSKPPPSPRSCGRPAKPIRGSQYVLHAHSICQRLTYA